jgi:hypothetical protein
MSPLSVKAFFLLLGILLLTACRQTTSTVAESPLNSVGEIPTATPTATRPPAVASSSNSLFGAGVNLPQPTVTPLSAAPTTAVPMGVLPSALSEMERINNYIAQAPQNWSRYADADGLLLTDGSSFVMIRAWSDVTPALNDWVTYFPGGRPEPNSNFRAGIAGREWNGLFIRNMVEGQQAGQGLYALSGSDLMTLTILAYVPQNPLVDSSTTWTEINGILRSLRLEATNG